LGVWQCQTYGVSACLAAVCAFRRFGITKQLNGILQTISLAPKLQLGSSIE